MAEVTLPLIDFKRDKTDIPGTVQRIARFWKYPIPLAEIKYKDGEIRHILVPIGLQPGDTVLAAENAPLKPGNVLPLKHIPIGIMIHNIERQPGKGGQLVRSAGSAAQVIAKDNELCVIRLPSGNINKLPLDCRATIGRLSHVSREKLKPLASQEVDEIRPGTNIILQQEQEHIEPAIAAKETGRKLKETEPKAERIDEEKPVKPYVVKAGREEKVEPLKLQEAIVPEKPLVMVQPPIGPSKTKFKVVISRCTPKKDVILSYEAYAIGSGWKIVTKKLDTDKSGSASTGISWNQSGTYDVWAKDMGTDLESGTARVVVI